MASRCCPQLTITQCIEWRCLEYCLGSWRPLDKLAVERDLFFVAEVEGAVVGTVMGGYDGHRGWIYSVAVAPHVQRQGIGAALIRHLEAALVARGCLKVNLQVRTSNAAVISFYRRLGYDVEERVSMGKRLY